jgi:hypothetical protein
VDPYSNQLVKKKRKIKKPNPDDVAKYYVEIDIGLG